MDILVSVAEKIAAVVGDPQIICGNSDYTVTFSFDSEWDSYTAKTARFVYCREGTVMHSDVLFEGCTVSVPVLRGVHEVAVGVYAGNIHTTTPARILCVPSVTCGDSPHMPPVPDVYNQLLEYLAGLQNKGGGVCGCASLNGEKVDEWVIGNGTVTPIEEE